MTPALLAPLAVSIPLVGALLIALAHRRPNLREAATLTTATTLFLCACAQLPSVLEGQRPRVVLGEPIPGVPLALHVEPLGMLFALIASFLWIVTSIYSIGYMRGNGESHQTRYYVYFAIALASTMGVAFAANLMTLFIAYEILTLSTYPLVTHHGTPEAVRAGRTYLGLLLSTSIGFQLVAILWTWQLAGTLAFRLGGIFADPPGATITALLLFLYLFGIGKAALMPLHRWLPAAMVAPTPVSALLHAVAVVKAGVFTVAKVVVYVFGLDLLRETGIAHWAVYVAGATILIASVIALRQDNLKRRLAYSTVSQLSYVIMAATVLAPLSVVGAAMHIAAHAFGKITLFFAAGAIYTAAHKTEISQLDGIGRAMPWTMGAFAIGSLSMIGLPPAVGFISKWYMLLGALDARNGFAIAVILVSTLLNAAYFAPIVYAAFFRPLKRESGGSAHGEAPLPIILALTITATLTLALFCVPDLPLALAFGLVGSMP